MLAREQNQSRGSRSAPNTFFRLILLLRGGTDEFKALRGDLAGIWLASVPLDLCS